MSEEIWKDIKDYEGYYQVSNMGRVRTLDRVVGHYSGFDKRIKGQMIKFSDLRGYSQMNMWKNNKSKTFLIHRVVAMAFLPNPENKKEVNHKNGNKKDNTVCNLEWCTQEENLNHAYMTGLLPVITPETRAKAELSGKSSKIVIDLNTGVFYNSAKELATLYGMTSSKLTKMLNGTTRNKTNFKYA